MSDLNHLGIDGKLLQLLVAVRDAGSITGAADHLGVSQSAVSHQLDKLRLIVGDPLFVKSGRGIVATARAEDLAVQARVLLDELRCFASAPEFDPAHLKQTFTIAANDLQRDLLLPGLLDDLRAASRGITLRVIPSDVPSAEMLRDGRCDVVISPRPPIAGDIVQMRLFDDRYCVFYDARAREAPASLDAYLAAEHVTVLYEPLRRLDIDQVLLARGYERDFVAQVPGFAGIPSFLRGSQRLATLPSLLRHNLLSAFGSAPLPMPCAPMPMYMLWHLRHRHDRVHSWLRDAILRQVPAALA